MSSPEESPDVMKTRNWLSVGVLVLGGTVILDSIDHINPASIVPEALVGAGVLVGLATLAYSALKHIIRRPSTEDLG